MQSNLGKMPYEAVLLLCKTCEPLGTEITYYTVFC